MYDLTQIRAQNTAASGGRHSEYNDRRSPIPERPSPTGNAEPRQRDGTTFHQYSAWLQFEQSLSAARRWDMI
jgi:hypothetical protein